MTEHKRRPNAGFTLVELLVVIVILGVLAAVVVFAVGGASSNATASACRSNVSAVENALEVFHAQNARYPSPGAAGQAELTSGTSPLLRSWPTSGDYTITLDPVVAGQVNVAMADGGGAAVSASSVANPCAGGSGSTVPSTASSTSTTSTSTTSTSTTSTTAAPANNGVTTTASVSGSTNPWYGDNQLSVTNTAPMTALSITIKIARTPGVTYNGQYTSFWGGTVNNGHATGATTLDYTFTSAPSTSIVAGTWTIAAQFNGTGTPRVTSGDTWSVTSTSGGVTVTRTGTF